MFVIWGYNPADKTCHAYGPYVDQTAADADAAKAKAIWPTWDILVQPVLALSPRYPQVADPTWLLWVTPFIYSGGGSTPASDPYSAYLSDDPAALDALGSAMEATPAANSYQVIKLEATVA
ncbi:MAG: hypothetical protein ACYCQK_01995 [Acidiferrobacteraceae bacterium]